MSDVLALVRPAGFARVSRDYLELSKSRIVMMVLITTAAGYFFAAPRVDWALLVNTLVSVLARHVRKARLDKLRQTTKRDWRKP